MTSDNDINITAIKTVLGFEALIYLDQVKPILRISDSNFKRLIDDYKRAKKRIE